MKFVVVQNCHHVVQKWSTKWWGRKGEHMRHCPPLQSFTTSAVAAIRLPTPPVDRWSWARQACRYCSRKGHDTLSQTFPHAHTSHWGSQWQSCLHNWWHPLTYDGGLCRRAAISAFCKGCASQHQCNWYPLLWSCQGRDSTHVHAQYYCNYDAMPSALAWLEHLCCKQCASCNDGIGRAFDKWEHKHKPNFSISFRDKQGPERRQETKQQVDDGRRGQSASSSSRLKGMQSCECEAQKILLLRSLVKPLQLSDWEPSALQSQRWLNPISPQRALAYLCSELAFSNHHEQGVNQSTPLKDHFPPFNLRESPLFSPVSNTLPLPSSAPDRDFETGLSLMQVLRQLVRMPTADLRVRLAPNSDEMSTKIIWQHFHSVSTLALLHGEHPGLLSEIPARAMRIIPQKLV